MVQYHNLLLSLSSQKARGLVVGIPEPMPSGRQNADACRQWYANNKEKILAKKKAWYAINKEKVKQQNKNNARIKEYRENKKEQRFHKWCEANKEKIKTWYENNCLIGGDST